jgi:hypothetical protein
VLMGIQRMLCSARFSVTFAIVRAALMRIINQLSRLFYRLGNLHPGNISYKRLAPLSLGIKANRTMLTLNDSARFMFAITQMKGSAETERGTMRNRQVICEIRD